MRKIDCYTDGGQRVRIFLDEDARIYFLAPDLAKILGIRMIKLAKQADGWQFIRIDKESDQRIRVYSEAAFWGINIQDGEPGADQLKELKKFAETDFLPGIRVKLFEAGQESVRGNISAMYIRLRKLFMDFTDEITGKDREEKGDAADGGRSAGSRPGSR